MNLNELVSAERHYASGSMGEPIQRLLQSLKDIDEAIVVAQRNEAVGNNAARAIRLTVFKQRMEAKSSQVLDMSRQSSDQWDANTFSQDFRTEVQTAIALED